MNNIVVNGAILTCTLAQTQNLGSLVVPSSRKCKVGSQGTGVVSDTEINTMGTCTVIASGNPGPCIPEPTGNWSPGSSKTKCEGTAILKDSDTILCSIGGTISVNMAGQSKVKVT